MWPSGNDFPGTYTEMFVRFPSAQVSTDHDFIAYRTPSRTDYWWGTYLVSREPVTRANLALVLREWEKHFGELTDIGKKIIEWEMPVGDIPAVLTDAANNLNEPSATFYANTVLVANAITTNTALPAANVTLRKATTADDFAAILQMTLADLAATPDSPATADFLRWKHEQFCAGVKAGGGSWWMLHVKENFVANCGLFSSGRTARFREVTTHPEWRRRGFARMICSLVLAEGFKDPAIEQVVIVAAQNSSAERIYRSIGFSPRTFKFALKWDLK